METQAEWDAAADCLALRISPNWALENAMSRWHLEDSLFLHGRRRDWYVFGAWRPNLSGMRPRTASHCVFAELGPRIRDVTTTPRRFPVLTQSPSRLICVLCMEAQSEWDAAVGWLALRFSPNEPSKRRCHDGTSKIPYFYTIAVEVSMCLVRGDPN